MFHVNKIHRPGSYSCKPVLGRTLPSLLDEAWTHNHDSHALNWWTESGWRSMSNQEFRQAAEELALGLLEEAIDKGDRVAFLMHSDVNFCLADMSCLLAGLIDVPIDLSQTLDNIVFILRHSEAKVLIVSDQDLLAQVVPYLWDTPSLQTIIVANVGDNWQEVRSQFLTCKTDSGEVVTKQYIDQANKATSACLCIPMLLCQGRQDRPCPELPQCIQLFSLDEVRARGKKLWSEAQRQQLRSQISPQHLATIVYIAGETGKPKGVMLTHENISSDILTTFKSIPDLKPGKPETVLSFLPLTHIFARAFVYGHLNYGHSLYFTTPNRAVKDFRKVRPTMVATVPRLLEKVYHKILERGSKLRGVKKVIFDWALSLAQGYELGKPLTLLEALQLKLADWLVYSQWKSPFGGRLKYFISGGAALRADIANILSAAGMTVLQGYGLTETSSVVCCNKAGLNRAGTVGLPIPGVRIVLASDGEILVKAPYVMQGYYKDASATQSVIDQAGWLHTGDLGKFTPEGFLTITGSKKDLFKLSTGKYVIPKPLENHLQSSSLVKQAVVVGEQKKFCAMLIFPDLDKLRDWTQDRGLYLPTSKLLKHPKIIALYQNLVDAANEKLPIWSKVKGFQLLDAEFTVENGLLDSSFKVCRAKVTEKFATAIHRLYGETEIQPAQASTVAIKPLVKKLRKKLQAQGRVSWRYIRRYLKSSITFPPTITWGLQENSNSEELKS